MVGRIERHENESGAVGRTTLKAHQLTLKGREQLSVDGVTNVDSFDEGAIIVETQQGVLIVRGESLHIKALNLESGQLSVEGVVQSLEYVGEGAGKRTRGLIGRLFK